MRKENETAAKTDWVAHNDAPPRSVFSNFKSEVVAPTGVLEETEKNEAFPLTPALSPRERENSSQSVGDTATGTVHGEQPLLFPLPAGEGQGEGEQSGLALQAAIDHAVARSFAYRFIAKVFEDPTPQGWAILTDAATQTSFRTALHVLAAGRAGLREGAEKLLATLTPESLEALRQLPRRVRPRRARAVSDERNRIRESQG